MDHCADPYEMWLDDPDVRSSALEVLGLLGSAAVGAFALWERYCRTRNSDAESSAELLDAQTDAEVRPREIQLDENRFLRELLADVRGELQSSRQERDALRAQLEAAESRNIELEARVEALCTALEQHEARLQRREALRNVPKHAAPDAETVEVDPDDTGWFHT